MKFKMNGHVVEIKVTGRDRKETEELSKAFINHISSAYSDSARYLSMMGLNAIAQENREMGSKLYNELDKKGYYDNL